MRFSLFFCLMFSIPLNVLAASTDLRQDPLLAWLPDDEMKIEGCWADLTDGTYGYCDEKDSRLQKGETIRFLKEKDQIQMLRNGTPFLRFRQKSGYYNRFEYFASPQGNGSLIYQSGWATDSGPGIGYEKNIYHAELKREGNIINLNESFVTEGVWQRGKYDSFKILLKVNPSN